MGQLGKAGRKEHDEKMKINISDGVGFGYEEHATAMNTNGAALTMRVIGQKGSNDVCRFREPGGVFSKHSVVIFGSIFQTRHL